MAARIDRRVEKYGRDMVIVHIYNLDPFGNQENFETLSDYQNGMELLMKFYEHDRCSTTFVNLDMPFLDCEYYVEYIDPGDEFKKPQFYEWQDEEGPIYYKAQEE